MVFKGAPSCVKFQEILRDWMARFRSASSSRVAFEILFVSLDRTEAEFLQHFQGLDCYAVPYVNRLAKVGENMVPF